MSQQCMVMLCPDNAKGLVRLNVYDGDEVRRVEVAMCQPCSDAIEVAIEEHRRIRITPGGAVYVGDLDNLIRRRTA